MPDCSLPSSNTAARGKVKDWRVTLLVACSTPKEIMMGTLWLFSSFKEVKDWRGTLLVACSTPDEIMMGA